MASFYCELRGSSGTVDPQPAIIGQSFAFLWVRMDRRAGTEARDHGCHHCLPQLQYLGLSGHRAQGRACDRLERDPGSHAGPQTGGTGALVGANIANYEVNWLSICDEAVAFQSGTKSAAPGFRATRCEAFGLATWLFAQPHTTIV